nr:MAG TPA: hypothetical protein [Caudoviricetes sp.]
MTHIVCSTLIITLAKYLSSKYFLYLCYYISRTCKYRICIIVLCSRR